MNETLGKRIEKAARKAVRNHYQCDGKYPCEERDYCEFCNGHNSAFDCKEGCGADDFFNGFLAGATWRINSVFHDNTDIPDRNLDKKEYGTGETILAKPISIDYYVLLVPLWEDKTGTLHLCGSESNYLMDEIEIWAYLDDLTPEETEDEE